MDSADNFQLHATRGLEPFLKGVADSKNVHVPRLKALSQKHELASADRQEILSLLTSLLCDHDLTVVVATLRLSGGCIRFRRGTSVRSRSLENSVIEWAADLNFQAWPALPGGLA